MNKKDIVAIEKILTCINELDIVCAGRTDEYFYDGYEMNILCDLVEEINKNLNKVNKKVKRKYDKINWDIIESYKEDDGILKVLKSGKIWCLASGVLSRELKNDLSDILKIELPLYYTNYCNRKHEKFIKNKKNDDK